MGMIDFLSGDVYKSEGSSQISEPTPFKVPMHSDVSSSPPYSPSLLASSPPSSVVNSSPGLTGHPVFDEPAPPLSQSGDRLPPAPWDAQPAGSLPPPPSSLAVQTQNLSHNSSTPSKQAKPEDALFKDLLDFAKSKSSSSSKPNNRSF
ncbi:hypothetical protein OIU78_012387 [Salix suchowensis]|nr:hypothetical protein OIU78_012387 [Salix suchowensis]